jgi:dihydroneopterin aldolase
LPLIRQTVALVAGRRPVCAAADMATAEAVAAGGVDVLRLSDAVRPGCIVTLHADASPDLSGLSRFAGAAGVLLDTRGGRLLDHLDITAVRRFVVACHAAGLAAWLAGGLELPDIPRLRLVAPDVLGFGAALGAPRLVPQRAQAIRRMIPSVEDAPPPAPAGVVADQAPADRVPADPGPADRVMVRDLVLPAAIGAYAHERGVRQRVRFAVTASVARLAAVPEAMADVFSYDVITDGIALMVDTERFLLVETLAERIAAMVLAHPRVTAVTVRVEKLEAGPARVGVEIERTRI